MLPLPLVACLGFTMTAELVDVPYRKLASCASWCLHEETLKGRPTGCSKQQAYVCEGF